MAFFSGQYNQAGGSWVDPSRVQTSQSGGAYIGPMAPQLPTQDMSFMWGGNGTPAPDTNNQSWMQTLGLSGGAAQTSTDGSASAYNPYGIDDGPAGGGYPTSTASATPSSQYSGDVGLNSYSQNPYLTQMGDGLRTQFTQFMNDGLAANRGNAVASGGVGGSRQGLAEARTMTDAGKGFDSALANLYGNDYQSQMNRNLQKYGLDQGYDVSRRGQDMGFFTNNRQLDQGDANLGLRMFGLANDGDWSALSSASGIYGPYTGFGNSTNSSESGGGIAGGIGGGLSGLAFARSMGWI